MGNAFTVGKHRGFIAAAFLSMGSLAQPADAATGTWTTQAPVPVGVAEVGVAEVGGKIYVIGGTEDHGNAPPQVASTQNLIYDPAKNSWKAGAPLPHGTSHAGVAALNGKIYVVGGFDNIVHMDPQASAYVYDPAKDSWRQLPNLSSPRGSVAVAAVGGKIHIFGGRISDKVVKIKTPDGGEMSIGIGTVNTHEVYDPATNRWTPGKPLPAPARDHMGVAVLNGKIHLFGGRINDFSDLLDRHDVYDPVKDTWTTAAPLPQARSAGGFTVLNGQIIYAGGECKPGGMPGTPNVFEQVTAYDAHLNRWTELAPLPQPRQAVGAATVAGVAYFVGGAQFCGGGDSTDVQALKF